MAFRFFRACTWLGSVLFVLGVAAPSGSETLADLVAYALNHHPEIGARKASIQAATEATSPARTWPDPKITVGIMNVSATEWTVGKMDMAQAAIGISQEIPIRGKLGLMYRVADADVTRANAALAGAKNTIAARVALAALDIYELDGTVEIEERIRDRYQEMVHVAEGRLAVGQTMQQDVVGMMLDVETSNAVIAEANERRVALVAKLNGLLDRPENAPFDHLTVAPLPPTPTDTSALVKAALSDQPAIERSRAATAQAEAARELKERERVPNPMVMARYGNRGGKAGLYEVGVSFMLPVRLDRRQNAEVRRATAVREMRRRETDATELETATRVRSLVARLAANERLLAAYNETLLPRAEDVVQATLASYSVGRTTLIMVLDAVRKLHRLQKAALRVEVMQRRMFVELEQTTGHADRIARGQARFVR